MTDTDITNSHLESISDALCRIADCMCRDRASPPEIDPQMEGVAKAMWDMVERTHGLTSQTDWNDCYPSVKDIYRKMAATAIDTFCTQKAEPIDFSQMASIYAGS